jgi:dolichyl-phosphate beta-glucosyltransferase
MHARELILVVPCYNEARRLRTDVFLEFARAHAGVGFLFVDDGSADDTWALQTGMALAAPGSIRAVRLDTNQGKAEAVRLGLIDAMTERPSLVGFWDADLSTPLTAVADFLNVAAKFSDVDLILGSRVLLMGRDIRRKASRHYLGRVFATAASLALDLPVYDTQCGAKVFRANDALGRVLSAPFRSRWIFDVEILARYTALPVDDGGAPRRSRIYELTVPAWHDVAGSKLDAWAFVRSIGELAAVWRSRRSARPATPSAPPDQRVPRG